MSEKLESHHQEVDEVVEDIEEDDPLEVDIEVDHRAVAAIDHPKVEVLLAEAIDHPKEAEMVVDIEADPKEDDRVEEDIEVEMAVEVVEAIADHPKEVVDPIETDPLIERVEMRIRGDTGSTEVDHHEVDNISSLRAKRSNQKIPASEMKRGFLSLKIYYLEEYVSDGAILSTLISNGHPVTRESIVPFPSLSIVSPS